MNEETQVNIYCMDQHIDQIYNAWMNTAKTLSKYDRKPKNIPTLSNFCQTPNNEHTRKTKPNVERLWPENERTQTRPAAPDQGGTYFLRGSFVCFCFCIWVSGHSCSELFVFLVVFELRSLCFVCVVFRCLVSGHSCSV